ncbi:hypothetical protein GGI16_005634 [Coemansia sp. S142-1]|nr:hypothetical protein H4S03_001787 [Coemansia sp. S3946]KAJ2094172.1 hypothetical protein GGI16_005634 [Coemansia sp. S142-1]
MPIPDGALGGVVDGLAPVTAGVGTTLNKLLGFTDSPSGSSGNSGSSSGSGQGGSGQGGSASGGSGQGGSASGGSGQGGNASGGSGQGGSSSGLLGGVVDALAPITAGVGKTVNQLAGFH